MKFILHNTRCNYLYGLDKEYYNILDKLKIKYTIEDYEKSDEFRKRYRIGYYLELCIIDIELFEILLLIGYISKELIITKDFSNILEGNEIHPILEIYDYWRE